MRSLRLPLSLVVGAVSLSLTLSGGPAWSEPPSPSSAGAASGAVGAPEIQAAVRALVNDRSLRDAQVGVSVIDVETGAVLAQSGEHTALNPASNAKLYTAAAALAILRGSHRYQTTLNGTIKNGAVAELVLRGHGDPSLRSRDLWMMAEELKAHGVRRVESLVVDQRFFDEQTTPPAFEQQPNEWASFRAPVSAVALNENTVTLTIRPTETGQPATASFDPPGFVDVDGTVKTAEAGADTVGLELAPAAGKRLTAKLSGAVGGDSKFVRYTRRVDDPQLLAGYALKAIFEEMGVKVGGDPKLATSVTSKGTVLVRHESEPLSTLLYALGKSSDNFYAEMIFKSLASEGKTRPGKSQDAAEFVTKWLEKNQLLDTGIVVKNGSGLFDANRTTAYGMTRLLKFAWQDPAVQSEYLAQLSIGGVDGTLHKRFRETRAHRAIRAKTGTLDDAIALSGYVLGPPGKHTIAFSVMFNKVSGKGSAARAAADKLAHLIYERQWKQAD
ncbi:D-alanyl-D-alanine carboxypeptidase/D-alanyl-D-alanine-endopeptidase [Labilithrix luteola]|nr:D-alanyl-D-alanine carboxypeptidase/D-alanyl-D-alanine-endopeptidase [Labilithrix luteola]